MGYLSTLGTVAVHFALNEWFPGLNGGLEVTLPSGADSVVQVAPVVS